MDFLAIVIISLLLIALFYVGISVYGFLLVYRLFLSLKIPVHTLEKDRQEVGTRVSFKSRDGVELEGRLLLSDRGSDRVIVFCHAVGSNMQSFFDYGWFLPERGFNVLTFNFRDHTQGGARFGVRPWVTNAEINDLVGAIQFVKARFSGPGGIGLMGVSRGACTALCVAPSQREIAAAVVDSGFDTRRTIESYIKKRTPQYLPVRRLPELIYRTQSYLAVKFAELSWGCRLPSVRKSISRIKNLPLFLIHGHDDVHIPAEHAQDLFKAAKGKAKQIWLAPGTGHNGSVRRHPEEYQRRVSTFFDQALGGAL